MINKIIITIAGLLFLLLTTNLYSGEIIVQWNKVNESGEIRDMHFLPGESEFILTTETDIQIRETETGELIEVFPANDKGLFEITPDSSKFVVTTGTQASRDKEILLELRDLNTMEILQSTSLRLEDGEVDPVYKTELYYHFVDLAVDPVRPYAYVIVKKRNARTDIHVDTTNLLVYNYETMEQIADITPKGFESEMLSHIAVSNDGQNLALMNNFKSYLHVYDLETMEMIRKLQLHNSQLLPDPDDYNCYPSHMEFSKNNTDNIYYSGVFPKFNQDIQSRNLVVIYNFNSNSIIDSMVVPNGKFEFFNIEKNLLFYSGSRTRVINFESKEVEFKRIVDQTIPFGEKVIYSNKFNLFLGFGSRYFASTKYDSQTNIENEETELTSIYPTPTTGWVTVDYECVESLVQYNIYDIDGALIFSNNVPNSNNRIEIDFSPYPIGTYFLHILCGEDVTTYKVVREG